MGDAADPRSPVPSDAQSHLGAPSGRPFRPRGTSRQQASAKGKGVPYATAEAGAQTLNVTRFTHELRTERIQIEGPHGNGVAME